MTMATRTLVVECAVDGGYGAWREQALRALAARWAPETVTWIERGPGRATAMEQLALGDAPAALWDDVNVNANANANADADADAKSDAIADTCAPAPPAPQVRISKALAQLLRDAARFRSAERWAFLYRVLWRWQAGDRAVASAADEDGARLHAMAKSVRRAMHDMIAYVRFREVGGPPPGPEADAIAAGEVAGDLPQFVAWYEPDHDVLGEAAEHFAKRMGTASWWIGTPQGAALWNGQSMQLSAAPEDTGASNAAAMRSAAKGDRAEPLWLAYYRSTFNPARINEAALHQHMPVRFWKGLPEGALIPGMVAEARNGARRVAQASTVGTMRGKQVAVEAEQALPQRAAPTSLDQCRRCELWEHATQAVAGLGPASARIMLVGEQPGDQEDLAGRPFVGPAGKVLHDAMRRAGVAPESVFMTNAVKHFKWVANGKRRLHKTPAQREVDACAHWLEQERATVRPAVIVTLGATALRAILGHKAELRDYLDTPVRTDDGTWLVATWHPSYALRAREPGAPEKIAAAIEAAMACARRLAAG